MSLFLTISAVHLIALLSPGPDFFYVSQTAISRSRREALAGVAGITLGVAWWAALALAGLQLVLHKVWWLQQVIAIGGGLYLGWMGYKMLRGALRPAASSTDAPVMLTAGAWRALRNGLLTNLANPKVVIYFGSIFSAFVGDRLSGGARWGLWTLVVLETLAWFALVAALFALPAMRRSYLRIGRWIDGGAGAVFIAFGLHLIARRGG